MSVGKTLHVLSAGAAKAVVQAVAAELRASSQIHVNAAFDAAGAILKQFEAGVPCDIVILPASMQDRLAAEGRIDGPSIAALGDVPTGIAVPEGEPAPPIGDRDALRASLERATALYCPDIERATAGIHFVRMLRAMEIHERVATRLRSYPNGAQAMAAMAADHAAAIGCTQVTEILYTPGVTLVGPLPAPFELSTVYSVAVSRASRDASLAGELAARLAGDDTRALRERGGFRQAASTSPASRR